MTKTTRAHRKDYIERPLPRRGMIMVLVLLFIVLVTALSVLVMGTTTQLVRTTRNEHEAIILRQMADCGLAWIRTKESALERGPVRLDADGMIPMDGVGQVTITKDSRHPDKAVIVAELTINHRRMSRTSTISLSRP
ncbi:MAG: PilX N-terminal domain-containing pilus assembly protein [Planctomycetota bacterium]|jgi:hypothetical protein